MGKFQYAGLALLGVALASWGASAQQPSPFDSPENLKVLPRDISREELIETMRGFSFALGVRCTHCHVQEEVEGQRPQMRFPKDDKETKQIAREMIKMLAQINNTVSALDRGAGHQFTKVTCTTCHRGQSKPVLIQTILDDAIAEGGADAAIEKFNALKAEFYGNHTYDFTGFTLSEYSNALAGKGGMEDALKLAEFSAETHPDVLYAQTVLADIYMAMERYNDAAKAFERAVALNPKSRFLKGQLEKAKQAAAGGE